MQEREKGRAAPCQPECRRRRYPQHRLAKTSRCTIREMARCKHSRTEYHRANHVAALQTRKDYHAAARAADVFFIFLRKHRTDVHE